MSDTTLKANLKALYDAGYIDFDENRIMLESNQSMSLDDIMACIDESKIEECTNIEDLEDERSSEATGEGLGENDIEEMKDFVPDSNVETDPELDV